ncbi:MAG: hypothetical protein KDK90_08440 [Leptospiraceae bacterium]|nr:hypothetical protein [Leptospiraceae bacterium]
MKKLITIIVFLLTIQITIHATEPIMLEEEKGEYLLGPHLDILEDKNKTLQVKDLAKNEIESLFQKSSDEVQNFGLSTSAFWVRFYLSNQEQYNREKWLIEISNPSLDSIEIYFPTTNNGYIKHIGGDKHPYSVRHLSHKNYVYFLPSNIDLSSPVYIRITTISEFFFRIKLWTLRKFSEYIHWEQYINGMYYGILLIMILYNLFIYFSVRDISYIYYIIGTTSLFFTLLSLDGLSYQYLWPNHPNWSHKSPGIFAFFTLIWWSLFCKHFLITKRYAPIFDKILSFLTLICLVIMLILFVNYNSLIDVISSIITITCMAFFLITGIHVLRKGYSPAMYYVLAWIGLIVAVSFYPLCGILQIPINSFFENYGIKIGSAIEILLFSLALANKINIIKKEREKALALKFKESQKLALLNNTFRKFVPHAFIDLLGKSSITEIQLGDCIEKEMSILFSDIRSFTTISENMSPQDNFKFVNSFMSAMGPIIRQHNGFIDKYIGDAIMALFSVSADNAVQAGIHMLQKIKEYNQERSKYWKNSINIGIGINTGPLMLGTIGEQDRMESTVISDAVNLASRLEGMTKMYGVSFLISEATLSRLEKPSAYSYRMLDKVQVKGKKDPVTVYEIFDGDIPEIKEAKLSILDTFETAINLYFEQKFQEAQNLFKDCQQKYPADKATQTYIERCQLLLEGKILWNQGITQLDRK